MKKILFSLAIIFSVSATAQTTFDMSLEEMLRQSPKGFASIQGRKTAHDDYGFAGDTYTVTRCIQGASKCVLQQSGFEATLKIRLSAEKVTWEEAEKLFKEWEPKIMAIKEWGKTAAWDNRESYKHYSAEFRADRNVDGWEKYKEINIQLQTYYFSEDEFQVVLTVTD